MKSYCSLSKQLTLCLLFVVSAVWAHAQGVKSSGDKSTAKNKSAQYKVKMTGEDSSQILIKADSTKTTTLSCNSWFVYSSVPISAEMLDFECKKVRNTKSLPAKVRLQFRKGDKVYRSVLNTSLCNDSLIMNGEKLIFYLASACDEVVGECETSNSCTDDCTVKNGYQPYRMVYDFQAQSICIHKRTQKGTWKPLHNRKLRLGVNNLMHLDVTNFNPIRDSLSLKYNFENLNLEGSQDWLAAMIKTPQAATDAVEEKSVDSEQTTENAVQESGIIPKGILNEPCPKIDPITVPSKIENTIWSSESNKWLSKMKTDLMDFANQPYSADNFEACSDSAKAVIEKYHGDIKKLKAVQQAFDLTALQDEMEKKFEEAKALPLAPDAAILKSELDAMIKKYPLLAGAAKSASGWKNWALELSGKLEEYSIDSKENREKMVADAASIQLMYSKMTNYTTTYFAPIQMQDYDRINLQFFSGKQAVNATPYRFYAKGGWKIDFSAGISMNGLNTKSYAYVDVNTENVNDTVSVTTGVIQDLSEAADYGVSTLMHVYPRFGWIFQPGFAVGAQLNNDQVTLLAGGSLMFGRQQRFCISGGMSFGPATKLKAGYEVGDRVEDSQAVNGGDVSFTHNVRSTSYFVSISYNLGGIN